VGEGKENEGVEMTDGFGLAALALTVSDMHTSHGKMTPPLMCYT
jgi:hypothetical protein